MKEKVSQTRKFHCQFIYALCIYILLFTEKILVFSFLKCVTNKKRNTLLFLAYFVETNYESYTNE